MRRPLALVLVSLCAGQRKALVELIESPFRQPAFCVACRGEVLGVSALHVGLKIFGPAERLIHDENSRIVARLVDVETEAILFFAKAGFRVAQHALGECLHVLEADAIDRNINEHRRPPRALAACKFNEQEI